MKTRWDAVVVEEAQDLSLNQWSIVETIGVGNRCPCILAIYDSNQKLQKKQSFYLPDGIVQVTLRRVVRNTKQIAEVAARFYRSGRENIECVGPDGPEVQGMEVSDQQDLPRAVTRFILQMVRDEGFRFCDVVVLCGKTTGRFLKKGLQIDGMSFRDIGSWWGTAHDDPVIACGSVRRFRGLESPVVVLTEIDEALEHELIEACYVGVSRARYVLGLAASRETLERIRGGLATAAGG